MTSGTRKIVGRAALAIFGATVFGRILGLVREQVIAYFFGASAATDAFFLAYKAPFLLSLTVAGALTATFVPVFTERYVAGEEERAWKLTVSMANLIFLLLLGTTLILVLLAPWLVPVIGWGFDAETADKAVFLFRILMPAVIFTGLVGLFTGVMNSLKRFGLPAFATSLGSAGAIVFMFFFADSWGITSLAVGTVFGAFLSLAVLVPSLRKLGMQYVPRINRHLPGMKEVGMLVWPILIGSAVGKVSIFADQVLASTLEEGSISALNFAEKLFQLPLGLFVAGITIPIFPLLSQQVAAGEPDRLKETLGFGMRMIAFIMVPAAVGLIVLRGPVIALLFEHGAFAASDTSRTAWALLFYALGLFSYAGRDTLTRVFYAYQDTRTPVKISVAAVVLNIAVSLVLMRFLGVGGLALGTTIAMTVNMIVLMELLRRRLGPMGFGRLLRSFLRILAAAGVMGLAVWGMDGLLADWVAVGNLGLGVRVGAGIAAGVVVYVGGAVLARIPELAEARDMMREVFRRSPSGIDVPGDQNTEL